MGETIEKLRPDRDLQCYFERPSAVAALSAASPTGFTISGTWRQQFDWAVLEWNRDNVFEHPAFRNLPDGDLSGLHLSYEETRTNAIAIDSDLFPTVDWPYLRIWLEGDAEPRKVRLRDHATPIEGAYQSATALLQLAGTPTAGDYIGISWGSEQYNYQLNGSDTIETAAAALAQAITYFSATMRADAAGTLITLTWRAAGANANRLGVYGFVAGARTEFWQTWWAQLSSGASPSKWRVDLDFSNLTDIGGNAVPMTAVRKMRWTYSAQLQAGAFERSEFAIEVSNWTVTGTNRSYTVAGPRSRRIEDDAQEASYSGSWIQAAGNFSGGTIHYTSSVGAGSACSYRATANHRLYLGTRKADSGAQIRISVDGGAPVTADLRIPGEDVLVRLPLGEYGAGDHTVTVESLGQEGKYFYFDFLEIAVPALEVPAVAADTKVSLATDWDTDHSICLAPERTAWQIRSLGFHGRVNHYVGALWFYELAKPGHQYALATLQFLGSPQFGDQTQITFGRTTDLTDITVLTHVHRIGDTADTVAKAFELEINSGYMSMRAVAQGNLLTVYARQMGAQGNEITLAAAPASGSYSVSASGPALTGGANGEWRTDLGSLPRLNRSARDWSRSFFAELAARGMTATAALSMELQHGDPSVEAGIAQRCPAGDPVLLSTPALQTNFSPASATFWKQAYRELAELMAQAGLQPYLQFGEVQWWYFRNERSGMPFYDDWTKAQFQAQYGRPMAVILDNTVPVAQYADEAVFLPALIGAFTAAVQSFVRETVPTCRFEVLYPVDVNDTEFNRAINFPAAEWTPAKLDCLKTESFTHTYERNLDRSRESILFAPSFPPHQRAHLIGISYPTTPWLKEVRLARAAGLSNVVLFALDQFCLIGYAAPLEAGSRRAGYQG